MRTVSWKRGVVYIIDQRKLPKRLSYLRCTNYVQVARAIREMAVRGAPAIGVSAAMGLALVAYRDKSKSKDELLSKLERAGEALKNTRPTAVNLFWAVERVLSKAKQASGTVESVRKAVIEEALAMAEEDVTVNMNIGKLGSSLINDGDIILTHCNTGTLATVSYGTALGVIRAAHGSGKKISVIVTETRPRLQGAKLTAFELKREGIPFKVAPDSAAPFLMQRGIVNKVIVGADRVLAKTGHVINKIGTLSLALGAKRYDVPFYVAAPLSSFDFVKEPNDVVIEERDEDEIHYVGRERITPKGVRAINPAFDITPPDLISGIITEEGIFNPKELMDRLVPRVITKD